MGKNSFEAGDVITTRYHRPQLGIIGYVYIFLSFSKVIHVAKIEKDGQWNEMSENHIYDWASIYPFISEWYYDTADNIPSNKLHFAFVSLFTAEDY